jgi:hypothetical protein
MDIGSAITVPLTREDNVYCMGRMRNPCSYEGHPANPVFVCCLDHDITQKLLTDPNSILRKPKKPKYFWLRTLVEGIGTGGQFVFDTFPPRDTNNSQNKLAARTLFQLDGDILVIIDEHILSRTDGIKIIKAHLSWTNWCLEQLKRAFSLTRILRCVRWPLSIIAVLTLLFGGIGFYKPEMSHSVNVVLILCGILFSVLSLIARKLTSFWLRRKIQQYL